MAVQYAFGKIITQGLDLNVDAADPTSYPGTGTSWTSVVNRSITGSLVSCSYSSDFKGGIVFNNPSASVQFPGTVANYGTGSFTVEMAFRPTQIQGIHYLVSKNSGSFPNWGVYLSGSGGSGKLWVTYNISAAISCSVSSSTTITTSSAYQTDVTFNPITTTIVVSLDGAYDVISSRGNGTGSLTTTGSLLVGNIAPSSSQAYSGSILNTKIYTIETSGYSNYKTLTPRFSKPIPVRPSKMQVLVVAGGGGHYSNGGGGGGAGGVLYSFRDTTPGTYSITVGAGGARDGGNGQSSSFADTISFGGGGGGPTFANNGGSGGGATRNQNNAGTGSAGQGNNGGQQGGGGGGAGGPGQPGGAGSKSGGPGLAFSITGVTTFYGGGGGGEYGGPGGIGGGGSGSGLGQNGQDGQPNTGGGGGGTAGYTGEYGGGGGSGIVVIRYPGPQIATGGTITQVAGDTIHLFTSTGSFTFTMV
jgi:hypothetical protein